ncbi:MAG TPA: S1C family serine protease [Patescibacteria group bacterium]|nr:S1C family serine protease [Patescibacteria group bacterium]
MLKKFTQTTIGQGKEKAKSPEQLPAQKITELPKIYQDDSFAKLEKPRGGAGMVAVAVILAILTSLTAVFTYEGFFRETIATDEGGQKIIVDKQENITVTAEERLKDMSESASQSVVNFYRQPTNEGTNFYEASKSLGSGVVLTNDGWLMTSKGLMDKIGTEKYVILASNAKIYEAQSVVKDPGSDLVFIKIEASDLPVAKLGEARALTSGQTVYGFISNYPSAKLASLHAAEVTTGAGGSIVESTEKMSAALFCREGYEGSLLGAPIINLAGEVVALINSGSEAVPTAYLKPILDGLLKKNKIERALFGAHYINLAAHPKINAKDAELITKGAMISGDKNIAAIVKNSPADKAGLKTGDIIMAVEDERLGADKSLGEIIQTYSAGQKIKMTVMSGGEEKAVEVTLGKVE